jgi:hypothetical protein
VGAGDTRQIQAITANPLSIEGKRPTLVVRNETQNWITANGGHEMAGAIEGNAAKSEGGAARMLDICNAYRPGQDSVGQRVREGWEKSQGDSPEVLDFGLLYDSLEAPPDAPLSADAAPSVVDAIRGDATWMSTKRIVASILNPANPASESRRKWYNQITAAEDARFDPNDVKRAMVLAALASRTATRSSSSVTGRSRMMRRALSRCGCRTGSLRFCTFSSPVRVRLWTGTPWITR